MLNSSYAIRRWHLSVIAIVIAMLALLGLRGYAAQEASLYSFIPLDSPVTVSVDVPLLWQSTADFRNNPMVSNGLQAVEEGLGLSFETDVLPWVGQAAFTVTDVRPDGPAWALFLQVRDADRMMGSARLEALLQKILQSGDRTKWLALDIKGVAVRRTEIAQGRSVLKVATATLDGWLVIAFGDGVIRKVIDARNGGIPSLETHPLFTRAMGGLPAGAVGQLCVNGQGILSQIQQRDADAGRQLKDSELGKFFLAGAMTYPGDILQFDTIYCTTSPKTQATLKQLRADVGTISGASLTQLPEGAFATFIIPNPDKWVGAVEQLILDSVGDANMRNEMEQGLSEFDGLRAVLKRCAGELGASVAWRDGKGFGVTIAGQTGAADDATAAAADFKDFLQKLQAPPVEQKDGLYTIPSTKGGGGVFSTLFCWTARKQWLLGASHPDWLAPQADKPALELPDFAKNANLAAVGNYEFLPSMMKSMGAGDDALAILSLLKLDLGQWAYAMKIDEDGGAVRSRISGGLPVIAVTAAVLFPVFAKAREKARQTTASLSNLQQLAIALLIYAQDHDERLPVMKTTADIKKQLIEYLGGADQLLISPRTNEPYTPNPVVSGKSIGTFADPATMIVLYEKTPGSDGSRCAAFLDGHVQQISAADWEAVKRKAKIP